MNCKCIVTDRNHLIVRIYNYDRHMIVYMTGLYTRLVTYARLHILILVVFFYHDTSYISFISLFLILIMLLSFISVIMLLLVSLLLCTSTFLFTHTHTRSLLTTLDSHVQVIRHFLILFRCSLSSYVSWGAEVSRFCLWYSFSLLPSCYFQILDIHQIQSLFQFFLYDIMRGYLYVILQWSLIYYDLDL